jgi:hypothetical protein
MLQQEKHETIKAINSKDKIYSLCENVLKLVAKQIDLPCRFKKGFIPLMYLILLLILSFSVWYFLLPNKNDSVSIDLKNKIILLDGKKEETMKPQPKPVIRIERLPIVDVKPYKGEQGKNRARKAQKVYNQAVLFDRSGQYKKALDLYKKSLETKDAMVQENAKLIQQRINYLSRHKLKP